MHKQQQPLIDLKVLLAAYYGFDKVLHVLKKHKVSSGDKGNGRVTNFAVVEPAVKSRCD